MEQLRTLMRPKALRESQGASVLRCGFAMSSNGDCTVPGCARISEDCCSISSTFGVVRQPLEIR